MKKLICLFLTVYSGFSYSKTDSAQADTPYKNTFIVLPAIGYSPNTSWFFGASGNYLFKPKGADSTTRTSNFNPFLVYTLEKQLLIQCTYTIFLKDEKYIISGDAVYLDFPQIYYGIGNNTLDINKENYSYKTFFMKPVFSKKLKGNLFAKVGYEYYNIFNVERKENGLLDLIERPPSYNGGVASGIMLGIGYDSRNNVLNSSKGIFLNFKSAFYPTMLGSGFVFQSYTLDARKYLMPFKNREDVIAFQGYGLFNFGATPFALLAQLGGETLMRGYYRGRYRDNHLLACQAEYRLHVWERFGFVGFAGFGDVANEISKFNINDIKYSYGMGLRIKLVKKELLNLRIDYGITPISRNFYVSIAEAF